MGDYIGAMHEQQIADLRRDREELDARIAQLEAAGWVLLKQIERNGPHAVYVAEFRAVLDGNATPTDRKDPDA